MCDVEILMSLDEGGIYSCFEIYGENDIIQILIAQFSDDYNERGKKIDELNDKSKSDIKEILLKELS